MSKGNKSAKFFLSHDTISRERSRERRPQLGLYKLQVKMEISYLQGREREREREGERERERCANCWFVIPASAPDGWHARPLTDIVHIEALIDLTTIG